MFRNNCDIFVSNLLSMLLIGGTFGRRQKYVEGYTTLTFVVSVKLFLISYFRPMTKIALKRLSLGTVTTLSLIHI